MRPCDATIGLFALLLGGCAGTPPEASQQAAPQNMTQQLAHHTTLMTPVALSDTPLFLGSAASLNADCTSVGDTMIRVTSPPSHGTVTISRGLFHTTYTQNNQRYSCNLKPTPGTGSVYRSAPGYVGPDDFVLDIISPEGNEGILHYQIQVK